MSLTRVTIVYKNSLPTAPLSANGALLDLYQANLSALLTSPWMGMATSISQTYTTLEFRNLHRMAILLLTGEAKDQGMASSI